MEKGGKISKELQVEAKAYRKSLYDASPEVKKFTAIKNAMLSVLLALILLDLVWKFILLWQQDAFEEIPKEFIKLLLMLLILFLAQRPWNGKWLLWLLVAGNLPAIPTYVEVFLQLKLYWMYSPVFIMMFLTELVYVIFIVFVTVWLTLPGKNRRYDEQAGEIEKKYTEYIIERMK